MSYNTLHSLCPLVTCHLSLRKNNVIEESEFYTLSPPGKDVCIHDMSYNTLTAPGYVLPLLQSVTECSNLATACAEQNKKYHIRRPADQTKSRHETECVLAVCLFWLLFVATKSDKKRAIYLQRRPFQII